MAQPVDFVGLNTFIYEPFGWDIEAQADLAGTLDPVEKIRNNNIPGLGPYDVPVEQNTLGYSLDVSTVYFHPSLGTLTNIDNQTERLINVKWNGSTGQRLPDPQTGNAPNDSTGSTRVKAQYLNVLNLRRNGPYGYPTWKQTRVGQNPLTRKQKKNNIFTYTIQGKEITPTSGVIVKNKHSEIFKFVETPVVSKYKPIEILAGVTDENTDKIRRAIIKAPMANDTAYFNHDVITRQMNLEYDESESYATIKKMYLHGALDSETSPIDSFEYTRYSETVFPSIKRAYQSHVRSRENFFFTWRKSNEYRVKPGVAFTGSVVHSAPGAIDNGFAFEVPYQSDWVLDAGWNILDFSPKQDGLFLTRTGSLGLTQYDDYGRLKPTRASISSASVYYYPIGGAHPYWNGDTAYNYRTGALSSSAGGEGQLMNSYCLFTDWRQVSASNGVHPLIDQFLTASSLYSRKTLIPTVAGLVANSGKDLDFLDNLADPLLNIYQYFGGATKWEAPETRKKYNLSGVLTSSIRYPMYDNYDDFAEYTRLIGKDYSIIPEFRVSNHIEFYQKQGLLEENPTMLQISGAATNLSDSSKEEFFKVYSNSDFMKHFDIVKEDHNGFVEPSAISLKCNVVKKLLPYDGFYPAQRANQLAKQFYKSYGDHFNLEEASIQVTDFPNRIEGTQTTELIFMPHHFNVIFESSNAQNRSYYANNPNTNFSFEETHGEYPKISHSIRVISNENIFSSFNALNSNKIWSQSKAGVVFIFDRIHQGNMGLQFEKIMSHGLRDAWYEQANAGTYTVRRVEQEAHLNFANMNVYACSKAAGHSPALRQWKYWMGINATKIDTGNHNGRLDAALSSIYEGSGAVMDTPANAMGRGDLNAARPNNLINGYCGDIAEHGSSLFSGPCVGFNALNLIPDEFAGAHHVIGAKVKKISSDTNASPASITQGFTKDYANVGHLNAGFPLDRVTVPAVRGNSPNYNQWDYNHNVTGVVTSVQGVRHGTHQMTFFDGENNESKYGNGKAIIPKTTMREPMYPTSFKTQYPMTMVSDGYGNYVAFLFVKDEGNREALNPWSGFDSNSFYDDPTSNAIKKMQRNYYVPCYKDTNVHTNTLYIDNTLVLPSRARTTSWSSSGFRNDNAGVYGCVPMGSVPFDTGDETIKSHWGTNMSQELGISTRQVVWEPLYNANGGSSLHPTSDWLTLSSASDITLYTGGTPDHTRTNNVTMPNNLTQELPTWNGEKVPATFNEFHPLQPPIVLIRVPRKNADDSSSTADHEWSSYYAAKHMAEAINDINKFQDDPTGKYKHLLPLYHAFSDGGIQDNNKIMGKKTLYIDKSTPWVDAGRTWDVTATFSQDSSNPLDDLSGRIPHPFSRLQITRNAPDPSTQDTKYWRYIVNWNSGIVLHERQQGTPSSTQFAPGAGHNDQNPNRLFDFYTPEQMDDFSVNHLGTTTEPQVAHGVLSHIYNDFSFTKANMTAVQTNPLSPLAANADSKYCRIQPLLNPLFAPGVLFNTIKSGIACDYPLMTDKVNRVLATVTGSEGDVSFWMIGSRGGAISAFVGAEDYFAAATTDIVKSGSTNVEIDNTFFQTATDKFDDARTVFDTLALKRNSNSNNFRGFNLRIPFDALIEPENYLAHQALINQEPDNFLYFDKYMRLEYETRWDGQGDQIYKKMAHNFLSEIPDFFLIDGSLKSIKSLEQGDSNFGNVTGFKSKPSATEDTPYCYKMRVKIYKSLDKTANTIFSNGVKVTPPQIYIPENDSRHPRETITMYSRPSSFGPPSWDGDFNVTYIDNNNKLIGSDNRKGYNFPFTPPYYHGEAWADITFKPKEIRKYSLSEILASSSVDYYRYWHPMTNTAIERRQSNSKIHFTNWTASLANPTGTVGNYYAPQHPLFVNDNAMQLDATLNLFGRTLEDQVVEREVTTPTVSPGAVGGLATALKIGSNTEIVVDTIQQDKARWVIQPKMETPILNFSHITSSNVLEVTHIKISTGKNQAGPLTVQVMPYLGSTSNFITISDGGLEHTIYFIEFGNTKPTSQVGLIKVDINSIDSEQTVASKLEEAINASSSLNASIDPQDPTNVIIETSVGISSLDAQINSSATTTFKNSITVKTATQGSQTPPISLAKQSPFTTTVGMWHQYGVIPTGSQGVFMQIEDVPKTWMKGALGVHTGLANLTASLADLVGFPKTSQRLGEVAMTKKIYEAVVAIPFIEESNERKFFEIPRRDIDNALDPSPEVRTVGNSIVSMVEKMSRYVFPPTMDFLRNRDITPFAMYIFEFSHVFKRQDLIDIWQNVAPEIGVSHQTATAVITHELLSSELIGGGTTREHPNRQAKNNLDRGIPLPEKIKWMVFKVKQRAKTNYYDKVFQRAGVEEEDTARRLSKVSFNWPYDYFSLVELVKLDASVVLSDVEEAPVSPNDDSTRSIKPKITKLKVPRSLMKSLATTRPSDLANKQDIIKRIKAEKLDGFKFQLAGDDD